MQSKNKKYIILGGLLIAFLLYFRRAKAAGVENALGLTVTPGTVYRSRSGYTVYHSSTLAAFATTGSNANFLVSGIETITIGNTLKKMARVTFVDTYGDAIHEWDFYLDINALTL